MRPNIYSVIIFSPGVCWHSMILKRLEYQNSWSCVYEDCILYVFSIFWIRWINIVRRGREKKSSKILTWFVVAVIILIGSVNPKATAEAKTSAHHGIWTWSFRKMHTMRETTSVTPSNTWNHQEGMSLYFFIIFVWISSLHSAEARRRSIISLHV